MCVLVIYNHVCRYHVCVQTCTKIGLDINGQSCDGSRANEQNKDVTVLSRSAQGCDLADACLLAVVMIDCSAYGRFAASCGKDTWQTVEIGSATAQLFGDVYVRAPQSYILTTQVISSLQSY